MKYLTGFLAKAKKDESGQTMAEYGLILAVVAIVALVAYQALGTSIATLINTVATSL
jgi:pilus assembly protein Flp/PilA